MKRTLILLTTAAISAMAILFLNFVIAAALGHPPVLNAPWPFALEAFLLTAVVGYVGRTRGWLMGMLSIVAIYTLLVLIVSFFIIVGALDVWQTGGSVMDLIEMNGSLDRVILAIQFIFVWIFLPSLAIGAVGGMIGELIYKKTAAGHLPGAR